MKFIINKKHKSEIPSTKLYDLGSVTTDINDLLNTSIINIDQNTIPILIIDSLNYLINNFNPNDYKEDFEILLAESDLISFSGSNNGTSSYIRITRAEAEILQSTSSFVPNTTYVITDADVNLYGGTEITLTAITENELSLQGSGLFYCPKYDLSAESTGYGIWTTYMEGTFSNVVGTFTSGETVTAQNGAKAIYLAEGFLNYVSGDWSGATAISGITATADVSGFISPSYAVNEVVHWGGKSWTNVNGNIGASTDKYTLDAEWTEIPFNATDYNVYIDEIQYDFGNDMIIYRKDRYNNVVSGSNLVFVKFDGYGYGNPIKDFQWGCGIDTNVYLYVGIQGNQVIDSYFETLNSRAKYIWFSEVSQFSFFKNNTLSSSSYIQNNTLSNSNIQNNTLSSSSYIQNNTLSSSSYIQNNNFSNNSYIQNNTLSGSYFQNNTLSNSNIQNNTLSGSYFQNNTLSSSSYFYNNNFSNNSYIQNNTLSGSYFQNNTLSNSNIQNNTLSSNNSNISYNTLSNSSRISYNTFNGFGSNISYNTLSSNSGIQYNTFNGFGSDIKDNTLSSNSNIQNNTLSGSRIQNNTLSNISLLQFTGGDVAFKTLTKLTMEGNDTTIPITATIIFNQNISKTIFKREDGASRLQYVNNSDVLVIGDVTM